MGLLRLHFDQPVRVDQDFLDPEHSQHRQTQHHI
jgi:hypothetical protein